MKPTFVMSQKFVPIEQKKKKVITFLLVSFKNCQLSELLSNGMDFLFSNSSVLNEE